MAEKEMLAVIYARKNWRLYLFKHFEVFSDNKALSIYWASYTCRNVRVNLVGFEFLTDFDYLIYHQQGHENVADPLSRLPDPQMNALEFVLDIHPDEAKEISEGYFKDKNLHRSSKD